MQIGVTTLVIVQVDMPQPRSVGSQNLFGGVVRDLQIGVADIEVQAELRNLLQEFSQLRGIVEISRQILDHESDAGPLRIRQQFPNRLDIPPNKKTAIVKGSIAVGMHIHPLGADGAEHLETTPQLRDRPQPHVFNRAGERQIESGMAHHFQPVML